ncbi:hypothetical protein SI65_06814 [Aspergillus cristatus]|uniref:Uncharacterized protein n=1 Tax=Aspergillus cristatus TaxID=573508 RepID=A0A1E3BCA4_ASPCR|nr:hypothetical protein SI65_06814 [Aspergillus cristatus]
MLVDKEQWLLGSKEVNVVILVSIKEDKEALSETKATEASRRRVRSLLIDFGSTKGKVLHMKEVQGEDEDIKEDFNEVVSDRGMYQEIRDMIDPDDWIGPLNVSLEVWERGPSGPQRQGERTQIIPKTDTAAPVIKITDLFPGSYYENLQDFDASRTREMDLDRFGHHLKQARKEVARDRALDFLRPWDD